MAKQSAKPYPNKLKEEVKMAGLTIGKLSEEINIPRSTLYYWSACRGIIPREARLKMAHVIGCKPEDLAPLLPKPAQGHNAEHRAF